MELVLLRVNSKTLGHKVNLDTIYMLNETRDRRHELLDDVPVHIWDQFTATLHHFVKAVC